MIKRLFILVPACSVLALACCSLISVNTAQAADISTKKIEKIFYISSGTAGIESFRKNAGKIDIIAPQAYTVSSNLKVSGNLNPEIKKIAIKNGNKIMPLVVNAGFQQKIIHNVLISTTAQNYIIQYLTEEAKRNGYAGWQFDFENIYYADRDLYSSFIEKTAKAFASSGLIFSTAAVARKTDFEDTDFYKNWSGVFDYKRIANAVDFISVMAYDDPNSKGSPASIPFVESVYAYLKDKIPSQKLSLGIPLYYWGWSINPYKKVRSGGTYDRLQYAKSHFDYYESFDESEGVPWLIYASNNKLYIIWFENDKSFEKKLQIIEENNLRGFSAWVLGVEDPKIWQTIESK